jgi:hypothetical protein
MSSGFSAPAAIQDLPDDANQQTHVDFLPVSLKNSPPPGPGRQPSPTGLPVAAEHPRRRRVAQQRTPSGKTASHDALQKGSGFSTPRSISVLGILSIALIGCDMAIHSSKDAAHDESSAGLSGKFFPAHGEFRRIRWLLRSRKGKFVRRFLALGLARA